MSAAELIIPMDLEVEVGPFVRVGEAVNQVILFWARRQIRTPHFAMPRHGISVEKVGHGEIKIVTLDENNY